MQVQAIENLRLLKYPEVSRCCLRSAARGWLQPRPCMRRVSCQSFLRSPQSFRPLLLRGELRQKASFVLAVGVVTTVWNSITFAKNYLDRRRQGNGCPTAAPAGPRGGATAPQGATTRGREARGQGRTGTERARSGGRAPGGAGGAAEARRSRQIFEKSGFCLLITSLVTPRASLPLLRRA